MRSIDELIASAEAGNAYADHALRALIAEHIGHSDHRDMPESLIAYYRKAMLTDPLRLPEGAKP